MSGGATVVALSLMADTCNLQCLEHGDKRQTEGRHKERRPPLIEHLDIMTDVY